MRLETIKIGRIVNAHGIRGEVRVQPDGQDPAFLTQFQTFYLDGAPVTPTANHVHKSLVLMKFPGVDDMNAALALKGKNLYIRRADAKLPEGACFDAELLGMTQSAISHQLKVLRENKLVASRREGKTIYYFLADDHVRTIIGQGFEHLTEHDHHSHPTNHSSKEEN